jgi:hypothetical protein
VSVGQLEKIRWDFQADQERCEREMEAANTVKAREYAKGKANAYRMAAGRIAGEIAELLTR